MSQFESRTLFLWKSGHLTDLQQTYGINNVKTAAEYCRLYEVYKTLREEGKNYTVAVELTAEKLCVTERKVRRAVAFCL